MWNNSLYLLSSPLELCIQTGWGIIKRSMVGTLVLAQFCMGNGKAWRCFQLQLYNIACHSSQQFFNNLWALGEIFEGTLNHTINFSNFLRLQNVLNRRHEVAWFGLLHAILATIFVHSLVREHTTTTPTQLTHWEEKKSPRPPTWACPGIVKKVGTSRNMS